MDLSIIALIMTVVALIIIMVVIGYSTYSTISKLRKDTEADKKQTQETQQDLSTDITTLSTSQSALSKDVQTRMKSLEKAMTQCNDLVDTRLDDIEAGFRDLKADRNGQFAFLDSNINIMNHALAGFSNQISQKVTRSLDIAMTMSNAFHEMHITQRLDSMSNVLTGIPGQLDTLTTTVTQFPSRLNALSNTVAHMAYMEPELASLSNTMGLLQPRMMTVAQEMDTLMDSLKADVVTRQLSIEDYIFQTDTQGRLTLRTKTSTSPDYLLLNNGQVQKSLTIMPGGMLNFSDLTSSGYSVQVNSNNTMSVRMPTMGAFQLADQPTNTQRHNLATDGTATHTKAVVTPVVQIGQFKLSQNGRNLIVQKPDDSIQVLSEL